ncbi:hypothetical protein BJ912DRAFT_920802 [Pholiota molesta]|nr:hypothetical protein BJ912DRAFT_920802 [Pholiota molesta]
MSVSSASVLYSPESFKREASDQDLGRSLLVWRACLTILHVLAILSAIYRLYRRTKTRQLWKDDYIAAFILLFDCVYFPSLWLQGASRHGLALTVENMVICARNTGDWEHTYPYQCSVPFPSVIFRTSMGSFADIALSVIPFCAFWRRLKLPRVTRRLIKACFAASLLTFITQGKGRDWFSGLSDVSSNGCNILACSKQSGPNVQPRIQSHEQQWVSYHYDEWSQLSGIYFQYNY